MNHTLAARVYALAKEYGRLCADGDAELLTHDEHATLLEIEARLNAYGNLLSATHPTTFLRHELNDAKAYLRCTRIKLRVSRPKRGDRM